MKKIILTVLLLTLTLTITGCGKKDSIVIYSSQEEERDQALKEQLKKKFPDLNVVVQHMGTGNSAAKIKTEGTKVEADIFIDLETAHAANLQDNFADITYFDDSIYLDGINTSDKYLTWVKYTLTLIVDNKYMQEHNIPIPKTYDDLLKPVYKNLIAMPDPKTSGTGYGFFLNVVNIKGEDEAVEYFKKLKENMREFTTSGSGPTNLLKQGEIAIAMGMTAQGVKAINDGYDYKIVELETGSPYNTTACGIIKGHEDKEHVKEVFEFVVNEFGRYDKENFMPDIILKEQNNKVANYPENLKDANMTGIDSIATKEHLTTRWEEVNG